MIKHLPSIVTMYMCMSFFRIPKIKKQTSLLFRGANVPAPPIKCSSRPCAICWLAAHATALCLPRTGTPETRGGTSSALPRSTSSPRRAPSALLRSFPFLCPRARLQLQAARCQAPRTNPAFTSFPPPASKQHRCGARPPRTTPASDPGARRFRSSNLPFFP